MRKKLLLKLLCIICLINMTTACNNDDNDEISREIIYSNKLSAPESNLELDYDGKALIGKDIYFKQQDASTANINLSGIFPNEKDFVINIELIPKSENKYSFSGNASSMNGITFNYEGTVSKDKMVMNFSNVKLPNNSLTTNATWITQSLYFQSDDPTLNTVITLAGKKINEALYSVLRDVTFHPNGNITAHYSPQSDTWTNSPTNLVFFAIKDNSIFILPNIDMIIKQIQDNHAKTRTDESNQITMEQIEAIYALANKWTTTGIRMNMQNSPSTLSLYLDKTEIQALFPVIPYLKELIPNAGEGLGSIIGTLLPTLAETLSKAEKVDIGITFKK